MNKITDTLCILEDLLFEISYRYYSSIIINKEIKHLSKEISGIPFYFYLVNNIHHGSNAKYHLENSEEPVN